MENNASIVVFVMIWVVIPSSVRPAVYEIQRGFRSSTAVIYTVSSRSMLRCAGECEKLSDICQGFNYRPGADPVCEVLSARIGASPTLGWMFGNSTRVDRSEFLLRNKATGKCVNVVGFPGIGHGDNVDSYTCDSNIANSDQVWSFDVYGRLSTRPSGKCLDVNGYRSSQPGENIAIYPCEDPYHSNTDHVWFFEYQYGTPYFRIRNYYTGGCLDVVGLADPGDGVNIQQEMCEGYYVSDTDQWWEKVHIDY